MKRIAVVAATAMACLLPATGAHADDRAESIRFKAGATSATISGSITGYDGVNYMLGARADQMIHVLFKPGHAACFFNFYTPGADTASHRGDVDGNEFSMRLSHSGNQRIQVYQMRNSARKGETCKYTLSVEVTGGSAGGSGASGAAASPRNMMANCRERAHRLLRTRLPNIEVKYEGQRTDGTHAVNGSAFVHGRHETFQCSFNAEGSRIVQFVVNHDEDAGPPGDALVPGTQFHATGNINCAQYEGQPYESCRFGVVRKGNGTATVTVFFPNGGRRMIHFVEGAAASSDSDAGVYSDHHSDLMTVFVGTDERYEIPEAVIYGG